MKKRLALVLAILTLGVILLNFAACDDVNGTSRPSATVPSEPIITASPMQTEATTEQTTAVATTEATSANIATETEASESSVDTEPVLSESETITTTKAATETTVPEQTPHTTPEPTTTTATTTATMVSSATTTVPVTTAKQPSHQYDWNDPNVSTHPIYATATSAVDLQSGGEGWKSAAEIIAQQKDPDNIVNGQLFYDLRMAPIQAWVDQYLADNGLSIAGKTDYEKTKIVIWRLASDVPKLEEFVQLWRPGFKFARKADGTLDGTDDCTPRAEACRFLMIAMDFEMINTLWCDAGAGPGTHVVNGFWDSGREEVLFMDLLFAADGSSRQQIMQLDELDENGRLLD
ncbi:MAG: hypothetical protein LBM12_02450 [Candidatus Nomurabacteria bacterium]|jgi:hypothetical protein|nr:hypothetical protein [Candidatus Nomurabacteria bacterium]